jgi:DNA-binding transcriptional regulator YhcF (GntR family)
MAGRSADDTGSVRSALASSSRLIALDAASRVPPFEQVRAQLAAQIADGALVAGTRLPTVRQLANQLNLAVNTVARAYRELELAGMVETRGRGGTVVSAGGDQTRERLRVSAQQYAELARDLGLGPDEALRLVHAALNPRSAHRDTRYPDEPSVHLAEVAISRPTMIDAAAAGADPVGPRRYAGQDFPECEPGDITMSLHWESVAGALSGHLDVMNVGPGACRLSGKPILAPLRADGSALTTEFIVTMESTVPGFIVLEPGKRATARVAWAGWDGEAASSEVRVSWPGGSIKVTASGPSQPSARGVGGAQNLSSSWFWLAD